MGKKLIYVSNNVINHKGNETSLFFQEKFFLLEKFGEFDVVCPKGIYRCKPGGKLEKTYTTTKKERILSHIKSLFDPEWYKEFFHMIRDRKFVAASAVRIFLFSGRGLLLEKLIKKCIKDIYADVYIYSYWMSYDAYAAAKIKSRHPEITTMTRAHSYELQIQRSVANPYLMKRFICDNMDKVAFISDNSLNEFLSYYEERKENFHVCYIGSSAKNSRYVVREKKDKLTLASCSAVIPIKQLDVIIEALADWDICPVKWIHIRHGSHAARLPDGE